MRVVARFLCPFLLVLVSPASAATAEPAAGGGAYRPGEDGPALTEAQREQVWKEIRANQASLRAAGVLASPQAQALSEPPVLGWPLATVPSYSRPGYHGVSNFVDHDPGAGLRDFECGSGTYNNHKGTDYFLWPFRWNLMAAGSVQIVAAAAGTIVLKHDGENDQSCTRHPAMWNAVYVEHADGSIAWYGHMKKNSLTTKGVGAAVARGEVLGLVGSSGDSTGPHLHLELYDAAGNLRDPYEGACNPVPSLWETQRPYIDSAVNRIMTGDAPVELTECSPDRDENEHAASHFLPGDTVYFTAFYRDQESDQISTYTVYRPDGTVFDTWTHAPPDPYYVASHWQESRTLPASAPSGTWRFEVTHEGVTHSHSFFVDEGIIGDSAFVETINRGFPGPVGTDSVIVSAAGTEITCPSGNPGGFSFCSSPVTLAGDSLDLDNASITFGFAPGEFSPTSDPRFLGYRVRGLDWPPNPSRVIREVTLNRINDVTGPDLRDVSFDCHEVRMNIARGIDVPAGGGAIRLQLTAGPPGVLEGNSLTLGVFGPDRSTTISAPVSSCIGANVEFPRIRAFKLASSDLANVSIDVDSTRISWDFSEAGSGTFGPADFNGYVFTDSLGTIPAIAGVEIDPALNSLGLEGSDVSFTEDEIAVNVEGEAFGPATKLRIHFDLADCDDGSDNDGDGFSDYPQDPGCTSVTENSELSSRQCDNGIDDDGDARVDWRSDGTGDPNCSSLTDNTEQVVSGGGCGFGPELALALPALWWLRWRRAA